MLPCLKHDFPTEWAAYANASGQVPIAATIDRSFLPYYVHGVKNANIFCDVRL
jgi:hypothetical protein